MIKLLYLQTGFTNMIKVKIIRNIGLLDITNNSSKSLMCSRDEALGIVDPLKMSKAPLKALL